LLTKPHPDFYTALEEETGKHFRELENEWLKWACNRFDVDFGKLYGEVLAAAKLTVTVTESITKTLTEKLTLTETRTITKVAHTTATTTKTTLITKTLTEIKIVYQTRRTEILEERLSITLVALVTAAILGLVTLALLLGKRRK